jgi:hypothetical protein
MNRLITCDRATPRGRHRQIIAPQRGEAEGALEPQARPAGAEQLHCCRTIAAVILKPAGCKCGKLQVEKVNLKPHLIRVGPGGRQLP